AAAGLRRRASPGHDGEAPAPARAEAEAEAEAEASAPAGRRLAAGPAPRARPEGDAQALEPPPCLSSGCTCDMIEGVSFRGRREFGDPGRRRSGLVVREPAALLPRRDHRPGGAARRGCR